jgi:soluble lytic murein transglycosylase-like protein
MNAIKDYGLKGSVFPFLFVRGLCAVVMFSATAHAFCFEEAGKRYNVNADVLRAIAKVESGNRPDVIATNKNGSRDIGLMQINSIHLKRLSQYGIGERELLDACVNVKVSAWLMADLVNRHGNQSWNTVGAYNAGCSSLKGQSCIQARAKYAKKIQSALRRLTSSQRPSLKSNQKGDRYDLVAIENH